MSYQTSQPDAETFAKNMETLQLFASHLQFQDRSPITIKGYLNDLKLFVRWAAANYSPSFSLQTLSTAAIQAYRQMLIESGARPQTTNRRLAALAAYGHWAAQSGQTPSNPAQNVRTVTSVGGLTPRWLDKRQRAALVRAAEKGAQLAQKRYPRLWVLRQRDTSMVLTLLNTGLRVGELCALRLNDVQIGERKGQMIVRAGKGMNHRVIPLNIHARQALSEWLQVRPPDSSHALFIGQRLGPIDAHAVQRAVNRIAHAAGLSNVTPHVLRHTFAKSLIDEGVSMEKVALLLGHSSLNTTRIYTVPGEQELEQAVELLDE